MRPELNRAPRLSGKSCLVTGAGQGIGRSIVNAFLADGAAVVATDRDVTLLDDLRAHENVSIALMDVTDVAAVNAVALANPGIDVLVNCAGWVASGTILDAAEEDLSRSFAINVQSMANTIRAFLPAMLDRQDGAIINIASVVSAGKAAPNRFAYATSKAAVVGLTKSVACDFIGKGIRCNCISPGTVESPSLEQRMRALGDLETARAAFIARQPMGRLGTTDEIASVAVLLASDEARFMTGSDIVIDGGMSL
jgi:2-keto-3-deoxy-L-fuconate dehydrogenase